jgi:hypothetical protein
MRFSGVRGQRLQKNPLRLRILYLKSKGIGPTPSLLALPEPFRNMIRFYQPDIRFALVRLF